MSGGFLHSQLSPVRRKMRLPGGSWPWETPGPLLFAFRLIAKLNRVLLFNKNKEDPD